MCGIAGIILRPGAGKEEINSSILQRLQKMTDAIQHRGPGRRRILGECG